MKQRILLVPDEDLYIAFRLPSMLREAGYGVDALCVAGNSSRRGRYLERVTTFESIEEQIDKLHRHMGKAGTWDKQIIAKKSVVRQLVQATSGLRFGRACGVSFSKIAAEWNETSNTTSIKTQRPGCYYIEAH